MSLVATLEFHDKKEYVKSNDGINIAFSEQLIR